MQLMHDPCVIPLRLSAAFSLSSVPVEWSGAVGCLTFESLLLLIFIIAVSAKKSRNPRKCGLLFPVSDRMHYASIYRCRYRPFSIALSNKNLVRRRLSCVLTLRRRYGSPFPSGSCHRAFLPCRTQTVLRPTRRGSPPSSYCKNTNYASHRDASPASPLP